MLVIHFANYPDQLGPSDKFVKSSTKINLPLNYQLLDQARYSIISSRTSNQAWAKGLDRGTYWK
jgi:hypothetical protein